MLLSCLFLFRQRNSSMELVCDQQIKLMPVKKTSLGIKQEPLLSIN